MERLNTSPNACLKYSEKLLPYDKETVRNAISVLELGLENESARALLIEVLTPIQAQNALSPKFKEAIATGLVLLESFVPEEEAERARSEINELFELLEKRDPADIALLKRKMRNEELD